MMLRNFFMLAWCVRHSELRGPKARPIPAWGNARATPQVKGPKKTTPSAKGGPISHINERRRLVPRRASSKPFSGVSKKNTAGGGQGMGPNLDERYDWD